MPRKSGLTEEVMASLEEALSVGATIKTACQYTGIGTTVYFKWLKRARNELAMMEEHDYDDPSPDGKPFVIFAARMEKAIGNYKVAALAKLEEAGDNGAWTALAWKLERRFADEYGRHVLELQGGQDIGANAQERTRERQTENDLLETARILSESGAFGPRPDPSH